MTTQDIFVAVAGALIVRDIVARIIGEIGYRIHVKKHGSIFDRFGIAEDED